MLDINWPLASFMNELDSSNPTKFIKSKIFDSLLSWIHEFIRYSNTNKTRMKARPMKSSDLMINESGIFNLTKE